MENFFIGELFFGPIADTLIFSKSSMGNPMENFPSGKETFCRPGGRRRLFSGPDVFTPIHCRLRFFLSPNAYLPRGTFSSGKETFCRPGGRRRLLSGPDVFTPIQCRLRFFSKSQRVSPMETFSTLQSLGHQYMALHGRGGSSHTQRRIYQGYHRGEVRFSPTPRPARFLFCPDVSTSVATFRRADRAKSSASKSPANSRRRRHLKASQGSLKCHSLRIR